MTIRSKLLVIFLAFGVAPMLAISFLNYLNGVRAVERMLRGTVEHDAQRIAGEIETAVREREAELSEMARKAALRDYVARASARTPDASLPVANRVTTIPPATAAGAGANPAAQTLPEEVRGEIQSYFAGRQQYYAAITCLNAEGRALFRVEGERGDDGKPHVRFQTSDFVSSSVRTDERVWTTNEAAPLRSPILHEQAGSILRTTLPIFLDAARTDGPRGALAVEMKLDAMLEELAEGRRRGADGEYVRAPAGGASAPAASGASAMPARLVVALDRSGQIVYHTNEALKHQPISNAMPFFQPVAEKMRASASGVEFFEDRAADGERWLAAFRPVESMGLMVAVAGNYTDAVAGLRRSGVSSVALTLLAALATTGLLIFLVGRTSRRIERVAAGAAAVASGDLNQHIEVEGHDETRVLAESFNRMTDQLRERIRNEAESRQFQSFMRLSAMLTHDLKNSILSLSLLVSNMEKQFHREDFRADAIDSLRAATDKLRRIVARLSEPVKSLSGEYRRDARETDLIPIFRRVLAATAEQSSLYRVSTRLPETLIAFIEPERIENVFENLVINALDAMGTGGGELTVEAGVEADGFVFFSVADTGVGMSEDFISQRLFRPFATTKNKGIGLGLYTCREIVETHGGRLDVESKLGVGTRFRVVLPSKPLTLRERLEQSQGRRTLSGSRSAS